MSSLQVPGLEIPGVDEVRAMSPSDLEALARELDGQRRALETASATLVSRVEEAGAYRIDGHRTVRAWGMAACNWSLPESARFVKAGHLLARFPSPAGMGVAQLHALAAVASNPRVAEHLDEGEQLLVGQAAVLDFDDYAVLLRQWEAAADPDGAHLSHERAHREREASLAHVGVKAYLNAHGGAVAGAQMREVLDAFAHSEFLADWEAGLGYLRRQRPNQQRYSVTLLCDSTYMSSLTIPDVEAVRAMSPAQLDGGRCSRWHR